MGGEHARVPVPAVRPRRVDRADPGHAEARRVEPDEADRRTESVLPQPDPALVDPLGDRVLVEVLARGVRRQPARLLGRVGVEGTEPREGQLHVRGHGDPGPAVGSHLRLDQLLEHVQPSVLVHPGPATGAPGQLLGKGPGGRQRAVQPQHLLAALDQCGCHLARRGIGQRHHEQRVRRERRGPHHDADRLAGRLVAHGQPPPRERRVRLARLDLRHRPGRHAGDNGAEHRVGLQQATCTSQELARVLGELERELHRSDVSGTRQTTSRSTPDSATSRARTPACWGGPNR